MAVNADKPHLWKADVARSVDFYNEWFMRFAPKVYREQRIKQTAYVEKELAHTDFLRDLSPEFLRRNPGVLSMLRMATAPPLARDRLIGLAYVTPNLIYSMEGKSGKKPRVPPRMPEDQLMEELGRVSRIVKQLADRDLFTWLDMDQQPAPETVRRASLVLADRLCGAASDPIIRNAQEQRQLDALRKWLEARGYTEVSSASLPSIAEMPVGAFCFLYNVPVQSGKRHVNIPIDCVIMPRRAQPGTLPLFIEAKSAGDFTNTNKRRKEEAQKVRQLRHSYGTSVQFILLLCGYFDTAYLGYEAAEGIDWVWEHRMDDLAYFGLDDGGFPLPSSPPDPPPSIVGESPPGYIKSESERRRLAFQRVLDAAKTQGERNRLGQFATPTALALDILTYARRLWPHGKQVRFLDPAIGTGSFFSALLETFPLEHIRRCKGFEIDPHYAEPAGELWGSTPLDLEIADFAEKPPPDAEEERFNLLICNPPYVRHHHLNASQKERLRSITERTLGIKPSGLTGLYAYFMYLAHAWMTCDGIGGWLIPSEFMDVNYGRSLRSYLLNRVTLLHVHRFDPEDVQFDDALVSSAIVWLKNAKPSPDHKVCFTFGGSLTAPNRTRYVPANELHTKDKWNWIFSAPAVNTGPSLKLGDLFYIKRGLATGANGFFILTPEEAQNRDLPARFLKPVLPSPRHLSGIVIETEADGMPALEHKRLLLDCPLPEAQVEKDYPALWTYLRTGIESGLHERYLCKHRTPWYHQENRPPAPFLCSYMGRSTEARRSPFRFFRNLSQAVAPNVYLNLYPRPHLKRLFEKDPALVQAVWEALTSVTRDMIVSNGRTYGGGLHKVEPKELANIDLYGLPVAILDEHFIQPELF